MQAKKILATFIKPICVVAILLNIVFALTNVNQLRGKLTGGKNTYLEQYKNSFDHLDKEKSEFYREMLILAEEEANTWQWTATNLITFFCTVIGILVWWRIPRTILPILNHEILDESVTKNIRTIRKMLLLIFILSMASYVIANFFVDHTKFENFLARPGNPFGADLISLYLKMSSAISIISTLVSLNFSGLNSLVSIGVTYFLEKVVNDRLKLQNENIELKTELELTV